MKKLIYFVLVVFLASFFSYSQFKPQSAEAVFVCNTISVTVPNGGETWVAGTINNITWSTIDNGNPWDDLSIYYSTDSGTSFPNLIVANTADDGQYEWPVPSGLDSSTVQVRIVGNLALSPCDGQYDDSDADFTVLTPFTNVKDTMSDSSIDSESNHVIEYGIIDPTVITDGSIKVDFPDEFNLTGVTSGDISVAGGDVVWGTEVVGVGADTIVVPFTGDLDDTDGKITVTINGANKPVNPSAIGEYRFSFSTHTANDGTGTPVESRSFSVYITQKITVSASVPSSLIFTIGGVASGNACSNSGGNADITTDSSSVAFGTYTGPESRVGCQNLTVSTNATNGYSVSVQQDQDLTSAGLDTMKPFSGTYAVPATWSTPPGSGTESYFGFTTDDTDYSDFQTAKYASFQLDKNPYVIAGEAGPVVDEQNTVSYQLELTSLQEEGNYYSTLMYIVTAVY